MFKKFIVKLIFVAISIFAFDFRYVQSVRRIDFFKWKNICQMLPKFNSVSDNPGYTSLSEQAFTDEINLFLNIMQQQKEAISWVEDTRACPVDVLTSFSSYVEKVVLPENAIVAMHGDLHGDVHSLNNFIEELALKGFMDVDNPFKIKEENFYIVFLGDYVDRGWYGVEVIYTILRLKNENPNKVFMVRGNHEDLDINSRSGFLHEISYKFFSSKSHNILDLIQKVYDCLPLALYIGTKDEDKYNFIQCCHGGIEMGFNPSLLLANDLVHAGVNISTLMQEDEFNKLAFNQIADFKKYFHNNKPLDTDNGFMWSDFVVASDSYLKLSSRDKFRGSILEYGEHVTKELLRQWSGPSYDIKAIFRAHQHFCPFMTNRILNLDNLGHEDDRGAAKLWIDNSEDHALAPGLLDDVSVVTFVVAPQAGYNFFIHAFGLLKLAQKYEDWRLDIIRI